MSMVNADSVQLFAMLKKMQDSISSIETTKKSVKMKYEQLGAGWQDKKYNELGVVVRDCNKALNDILVIMLQAEKYVALLAKSLSEYESVQLGSTNGISASTPQTSSFAVTPSSADTTTFESNTFGSNLAFVQDRLSAERYFSRGNHYEEYRDYWENGNYTFSRNENPELVYVRARDIEGVYLSDRELGNPEGFWTRNGREGWSRENILRRASHIQDVRQNTESGMSLDELSQNPVLDDTIRSYYNNPVQVAQVGSYYDNVNLDTPSARNSFLQGLQTPNVGNSSYQYCLGVLTQGSTPDGYIAVISQRHENAEQNVREVFDHFAGKLMIQDSEYPPDQTAHYSPGNYIGHSRGVYYNAASDMTNPRGAGTTYFHELAHMIDHASCNYRSNLSNTPEFAEALVEDGQRILSLYNNLPVEKQTAFLTRIRQDSAHSFSDLIDATTNGQLHGNYGHSRNYWTRPGNLQAEAFAHFFEASMGDQGKLELLANFFPTAFGIFSSMIDSIRPDNHVRVLSRER